MKTRIPIIDLEGLCNGDQQPNNEIQRLVIQRVSKELDQALSSIGFVYLKNHGIPEALLERVLKFSARLFSQPLSVKSKRMITGKYLDMNQRANGYLCSGLEMLESKNRHEVREAYDITSLDGYFPDKEEPEFRKAISDLVPQLIQLSHKLLRCLALAIGLQEDFFTRCHTMMCQGSDKNATTFRTLFYPSLADRAVEAGVERCGRHSDYGTITLLFQDDVGGLEVFSGDQWIPAVPIPGTILVNVGDLMQFWTGNRYLATIHRVRVPEEELRRRLPRQSIAFFVHPDNDVMVSPLVGCKQHTPISALAHLNLRYSQTYKY